MPVIELGSSTEADKKKQETSSRKIEDALDPEQNRAETYPRLMPSDEQYYRSNLLGEIYSKMSGIEPRFKPGSYVEYFA